MKTVKRPLTIVSLLVAVLLVGCSTSKSSSSTSSNNLSSGNTTKVRTLDEIKESGTIRIGVFSDKKPFGYVDDKGDYQGYNVYFVDRLAKDLGVDVEYVAVDPASRVRYLTSAKVDIVLTDFIVTDERAEQVGSVFPYTKAALRVVSPGSKSISSVDDLEGKTLIVGKGATAETHFEKSYLKVNSLGYDQYSEAYQALLDGRDDALLTDNTGVFAWALENKGYEVGITSLGDTDTIAPAVQKGNTEFLGWINDEIKALGKENSFHKDCEETLEPVCGDAANSDDLVVEGGNVD